MDQIFIAEVKTESPFGFKSRYSWDELFAVANNHGDLISIHTDSRWGGSYDLIRKAKSLTDKPIFAKGFHGSEKEIKKAFDAGADYVLTVGWMPYCFNSFNFNNVVVEVLNTAQLWGFQPFGKNFVWNSRDLDTGKLKKETWEDAQAVSRFPCNLIQASNIRTIHDIKPDAYGFIVGENLVNFVDSLPKN